MQEEQAPGKVTYRFDTAIDQAASLRKIQESNEHDFAFVIRLHRKQLPRKTSSRRFPA